MGCLTHSFLHFAATSSPGLPLGCQRCMENGEEGLVFREGRPGPCVCSCSLLFRVGLPLSCFFQTWSFTLWASSDSGWDHESCSCSLQGHLPYGTAQLGPFLVKKNYFAPC